MFECGVRCVAAHPVVQKLSDSHCEDAERLSDQTCHQSAAGPEHDKLYKSDLIVEGGNVYMEAVGSLVSDELFFNHCTEGIKINTVTNKISFVDKIHFLKPSIVLSEL